MSETVPRREADDDERDVPSPTSVIVHSYQLVERAYCVVFPLACGWRVQEEPPDPWRMPTAWESCRAALPDIRAAAAAAEQALQQVRDRVRELRLDVHALQPFDDRSATAHEFAARHVASVHLWLEWGALESDPIRLDREARYRGEPGHDMIDGHDVARLFRELQLEESAILATSQAVPPGTAVDPDDEHDSGQEIDDARSVAQIRSKKSHLAFLALRPTWATVSRVADDSGVSDSTVARLADRFEGELIETTERKGGPRLIRLTGRGAAAQARLPDMLGG